MIPVRRLALARPIGESQRDRKEAAEIFGEDADEDPAVCNDPYSSPQSPLR